MFDTVSKHLIEEFSPDFATWLLGVPCPLTNLEPSELSLEPIRADSVFAANEEVILHLEMQTQPHPDIPFRLLDYYTRLYRKYPTRQVKQVVIYLKQSNSPLVQQNSFRSPNAIHTFEVIRLWEQPTDRFLKKVGLLPFAVLSCTNDREATLRAVATQIDNIPDPRVRSIIQSSTAILAGLVLEKEVIGRTLRRDMMKESVIYQEILEEGRQEGIIRGRQEGLREGVARGRQEGLQEGRQEGLQEGITEATILIAKNFLNLGVAIEQVAVATGLSLEELQKLDPRNTPSIGS